ncbi:hypothetical protein [Weissella confusa]|uniref:hypothetical protein n=1 Tax=Weissella confusa TaxID=1583 RepID=UPI0021A476AF|nr:hypothetical protein [Weissella confusa]MCT2911063.1 hypothetical protein [Weissella confusa]
MVAVTINQSYLDRVGRLVGEIYAAQMTEKEVYEYVGVSKTTWMNVKTGFAGQKTIDRVLNDAEMYVAGVLNERRKQIN